MEKTITYLGIEKVTYKFTEYEILEALLVRFNIKSSSDYAFRLVEEWEEEAPYAELVISYAKEKE